MPTADNYLSLFAKGLAMGAANVIPGVSGGTIALITGIYQRLINAIKSCDHNAIKLLLTGKAKAFWQHIDGSFLAALAIGILVSIVSLARLFEYLLENYERYTMAFFFGLILLSIYYVGKQVSTWNISTVISLLIGTAIAIATALLAPASENPSFWYVFLCGVVAISSMILPGLSGSFILIIMGNYALILGAISSFNMAILLPLATGCAFGIIVFSHLIAWIFKHYENQTLAAMTGFVLGSLVIIWPWKTAVMQTIEREGKPAKEVVERYIWSWPDWAQTETFIALALVVAGAAAVALMERVASD